MVNQSPARRKKDEGGHPDHGDPGTEGEQGGEGQLRGSKAFEVNQSLWWIWQTLPYDSIKKSESGSYVKKKETITLLLSYSNAGVNESEMHAKYEILIFKD